MLLTIGFVDKENNEQLNVEYITDVVDVSLTLPTRLEFVRFDSEKGKNGKFGVRDGFIWFGVHLDNINLDNLMVEKQTEEFGVE